MLNAPILTDKEIKEIEENIVPQILQGVIAGANILGYTIDIMKNKGLYDQIGKHMKKALCALMDNGFTREEAMQLLVPTKAYGSFK